MLASIDATHTHTQPAHMLLCSRSAGVCTSHCNSDNVLWVFYNDTRHDHCASIFIRSPQSPILTIHVHALHYSNTRYTRTTLLQGAEEFALEMCGHCSQLQADRSPEGLLLDYGGGRCLHVGRTLAPEHDRDQESPGRIAGSKRN